MSIFGITSELLKGHAAIAHAHKIDTDHAAGGLDGPDHLIFMHHIPALSLPRKSRHNHRNLALAQPENRSMFPASRGVIPKGFEMLPIHWIFIGQRP